MVSKALLVLLLLSASVLLLSAEVAPKDADKKFDKNEVFVLRFEDNNNLDRNGVDDMKYDEGWWRGYDGWRRGYGGWRRVMEDGGVDGTAPMVVVVGITTETCVQGAAIILVNMLMLTLKLSLATKQDLCAENGSCNLYK
ncbi:unnamed protein product [Sphenostylis stenocarpa]|uniref:Uncharacterized protein n=1 Tax=Sphenostylis stenocarpa TaxID=92480 RepID=A0AA86RWV0_9FABA|nr:unnamed protein product [Sphenostylis stenocarpa]